MLTLYYFSAAPLVTAATATVTAAVLLRGAVSSFETDGGGGLEFLDFNVFSTAQSERERKSINKSICLSLLY